MPRRKLPIWQPSREQMDLWPPLSGNAINGVGEVAPRRPKPIYWHAPDATPHGKLQPWFYGRTANQGEELTEARRERQRAIDEPLVPKATLRRERSESWSDLVKQVARGAGADDVGIAVMKADYVFEGLAVPTEPWMVVLALGLASGGNPSICERHSHGQGARQLAARRGLRCAPLWWPDGRFVLADSSCDRGWPRGAG